MTIQDLVDRFRTTYDIGSLGLPGFEDSEIQELLELAQYRIISQKFGGNNVYKQKFPDTSKRIDDLKNLIIREPFIDIPSVIESSTLGYSYMTLPDDYLHIVELFITYDDNYIDRAVQVDYDNIIKFQKSNRNQNPYIKDPIFIFDNTDKLRIYIDSSKILKAYSSGVSGAGSLTYIKTPTALTGTISGTISDFNNDVYYEIVASAIDNAIEIATPTKSQVSNQQLTKSE